MFVLKKTFPYLPNNNLRSCFQPSNQPLTLNELLEKCFTGSASVVVMVIIQDDF